MVGHRWQVTSQTGSPQSTLEITAEVTFATLRASLATWYSGRGALSPLESPWRVRWRGRLSTFAADFAWSDSWWMAWEPASISGRLSIPSGYHCSWQPWVIWEQAWGRVWREEGPSSYSWAGRGGYDSPKWEGRSWPGQKKFGKTDRFTPLLGPLIAQSPCRGLMYEWGSASFSME